MKIEKWRYNGDSKGKCIVCAEKAWDMFALKSGSVSLKIRKCGDCKFDKKAIQKIISFSTTATSMIMEGEK